MRSDEYLEALSFASNYLACVQVEGCPVFRYCCYSLGRGHAVAVDAQIWISNALTNITVTVPLNWRKVVPRVHCHEAWFRKGNIDWHAYKDGGLCYIHHEEWIDQVSVMTQERGTGGDIVSLSATQCAQLSVQLMERHLLGHRRKIKNWPKSWIAWSHNNIGTNQYRLERPHRISEFSAAYRKKPQTIKK